MSARHPFMIFLSTRYVKRSLFLFFVFSIYCIIILGLKHDNDLVKLCFEGDHSSNLPSIAITDAMQYSLNFAFSLVDIDDLFNMELAASLISTPFQLHLFDSKSVF